MAKNNWNPYTEKQDTELWTPPKGGGIGTINSDRQNNGYGGQGGTSMQIPTNSGGYTNTTSNTSATQNAYQSILDRYEREQRSSASRARRAQEEARRAAYNSGVGKLGTASENALRQAYINKVKTLNDLPQQNAVLGNTGGLSESSLIGLNANYGNDRSDIESARLAGVSDLESQLQQGLAGDTAAYQNKLSDIGARGMEAQLVYQRELDRMQQQQQAAGSANYKNQAMSAQRQSAYSQMMSSGNPKSWLTSNAGKMDYDTYNWLTEQYSGYSKAGLYQNEPPASNKISSAFSGMIASGNPSQWLSQYSKDFTDSELSDLLKMYGSYNSYGSNFTDTK